MTATQDTSQEDYVDNVDHECVVCFTLKNVCRCQFGHYACRLIHYNAVKLHMGNSEHLNVGVSNNKMRLLH